MNDFLIKRFVKNWQETGTPEVRESYGKLAGAVGIASNLVLCVIKILAGLIFDSISILADGINNLSDAAGSLITLVGFKLSGRAPDSDHPYGHGRTEYLTGLVISVMVTAIGLSLLKSSIEKTIHPEAGEFSILAIVILAVAIAVKLWQAGFNTSIGKKIDSDALKAAAADSRNDVISTSAVLAAALVGKLINVNLDGPVGILVALFILWSGIGLVKEAVAPILGQAPDEELVEDIRSTVMAHDGILGVHDLIVHDYGPGRMFASLHAEVSSRENVMDTHDLIDNIEREVYEKQHVLLTIHMDPLDVEDPLRAVVAGQLEDIIAKKDCILSYHDLRVVTGPTHDNIVFDIVLSFDSPETEGEIKDYIKAELKKYSDRYNAVITVDRKYA